MAPDGSSSSRWWRRRALIAHLSLLLWFPGCLIAGWWQVTVATSGNGLAYLYAVEWPIFAVFGVVLWWNVIHDDPATHGSQKLKALREEQQQRDKAQGQLGETPLRLAQSDAQPSVPSSRDTHDHDHHDHDHHDPDYHDPDHHDPEALRAYNDYLEQLAKQNLPKTWRRR